MKASPVIPISSDKDDCKRDLIRALHVEPLLRKKNGQFYSRGYIFKKLKSVRETAEYAQLNFHDIPEVTNLRFYAEKFQRNICIWSMPAHGKIPELLHSVFVEQNFIEIHLAAPYFNEPNNFSLENLHLITNVDDFKKKISNKQEGNIFQCLFWSEFSMCESWEELANLYGSFEIDLAAEPDFIKVFGVGFEIYITTYSGGQRNHRKKTEIIHKTRCSDEQNFISLEYVGADWPETKSSIEEYDHFILRPKFFHKRYTCPNSHCSHYFYKKSKFERHLRFCKNEPIVEFKQRVMTDKSIRDWCIKKGFIPPGYHQKDFCAFDIESISDKPNDEINLRNKTKLINIQRAITVSISKSFGNLETKVIVRKSMSEEHYDEFIKDFMTSLLVLQEEYAREIPKTITDGISFIDNEIRAFKEKERNYSFQTMKLFSQAKHYLRNLCSLRCYGYNSSKYDLPCLFPGLLNYSNKYKYKLSLVKRGNAIISMKIQSIVFVDACNFTSGCSLDDFTRMWGAQTNKSIFPYEKFESIKSLKEQKHWPEMSDFHSSLRTPKFTISLNDLEKLHQKISNIFGTTEAEFIKQIDPTTGCSSKQDLALCKFPVDVEVYVEMWILFEKSITSGEMQSMLDFLKFYNSLDTISLVQAFQNYVSSFLENFDVCPNDFITLPGLSERIMWNKCNIDKYLPYTFGPQFGHLNKLIRDNLKGGLSCVFARHITVGQSVNNFAKQVNYAPNGERYDRIVAMDANSEC